MRRPNKDIKLITYDDLLGNEVGSEAKNQIVRVPLKLMHPFSEHPFRVQQDSKMAETVESIKKYGVLEPGLVRPHKEIKGEYEIISGHRRHCASGLAGEEDMPVIIKDVSDDMATVIMVDSNIQREDLLPSEKAKAYRMKYDALKRIGADDGVRNDMVLAKEAGESRNTIQRYIRLTFLTEKLLQMVDDGRLPKNTAVEISFLNETEQEQLEKIIIRNNTIPSGVQAKELHELSKLGALTWEKMNNLLLGIEGSEKKDAHKFSLKDKEIRRYFPKEYTVEQMEATIIMLLKEWNMSNNHTL